MEGAKDLVLEALGTKFVHGKPPIAQRIRGIDNKDLLKAFLKTAMKASSIEEFEQRL